MELRSVVRHQAHKVIVLYASGISLEPESVGTKRQYGLIAVAAFCTLFMGMHGAAFQTQPQASSASTIPPEARIDINSATVEELLKVPGMTRTWAERVVRFRPYHAKDDLVLRGVVTSQVYDRIKGYIIAHRDKP